MEETLVSVPPHSETEVTRAAGIIALGSIVSRVLGVARETVKSGLFGATGSVGALEVAIRVPTLLFDLLVGGMINSALVPVFSDYVAPDRREGLWCLLSVLLSVAVVGLSGCILLGEIFAPQIVWLMAGGLPPDLQAEATALLRVMLPAVLFLNTAGIISAALYALKRFTLPAFTAAIYNAAIVVIALLFHKQLGVASMALGLLVGAVLQLTLQLPGLCDAHVSFVLDSAVDALRRISRLYVPIAFGLIIDMLGVALSYNLASRTGPRSIPWMQYSATLIQFPLGLVSIAVSIAILPMLSQHATEGKSVPYKATLAHGLRLVLALTIPATVGLWILAQPIVALVFEHGQFTAADTLATVDALRCHLVGLIFAAVDQPLVFAFYARKDTWTPALVGVGTVVMYVVIALVPTLFIPLTLNHLVLANSLKWAAHALIMLWLLRRKTGGLGQHGITAVVLKSIVASGVMALAVLPLLDILHRVLPAGLLYELLLVATSGSVGTAVFVLMAVLMRMDDISILGRLLVDKLRVLTGLGR